MASYDYEVCQYFPGSGWECVDTHETLKDAYASAAIYRREQPQYAVKVRRVKANPPYRRSHYDDRTSAEVLTRLIVKASDSGEQWALNSANALIAGQQFTPQAIALSHGWAQALWGWVALADSHLEQYGSRIGNDGYAGPYWTDIGRALLKLLSTDIGYLDGGMCDEALRQIAEANNVNGDDL